MIEDELTTQLDGLARVLHDVVLHHVDSAYARDVLSGAIATIRTLAAAATELDAFLDADLVATAEALALVGATVADDDPSVSPGERLAKRRAALEAAIDTATLTPASIAALGSIFQGRAARYPFRTRPTKG
ncbi:MAG TPA: hypothetical protein PKV27_06630 [Ilumatobacteraceae bacterium]|nr:hypothetical protein [Ilumatobacteraceae bacterium]